MDKEPPVTTESLRSTLASSTGSGLAFIFNLPDGLSLRSVAIVDGIPEFRFGATPNVPTITSEDIAGALRLASDGAKPEFYYIPIPSCHPYFGRQFKEYRPLWLRGTSIGDLLSKVDWSMKSLTRGLRSNDDRSEFWAWKETSKLIGLASAIDFPRETSGGSVIMSCKRVKVQRSDNQLIFKGQPKMQICAEASAQYSKYISDVFPSVAHYDEPLFLKMRELIKLIVAAEWLLEKGVCIDKNWMMEYTKPQQEQQTQAVALKSSANSNIDREIFDLVKTLPKNVHREVTGVLGPMTVNITIDKTFCRDNCMELKLTRRIQLSPALPEVKETATIKASVHNLDELYRGMDPNQPIRPQIPEVCEEIVPHVQSWSELFRETEPWPQAWHLHKVSRKEFQMSAACGGVSTRSIPVKSTYREVPADSCKTTWESSHYGSHGENIAVRASSYHKGERGRAAAPPHQIVPQPRHFQPPTSDVSVAGGSSRHSQMTNSRYGYCNPMSGDIDMREADGTPTLQAQAMRAICTREVSMDGQPQSTVKVFSGFPIPRSPGIQHNPVKIEVATPEEVLDVTQKFKCKWSSKKGPCAKICKIFTVTNRILRQKWEAYKRTLRHQKVEEHYHGTELACNINNDKDLCTSQKCGICGISRIGFDMQRIGTNIKFRRFGDGFYLAPNSSKCHDYTVGNNGCRAMLLCDVCPGRKYCLKKTSIHMNGPPKDHGYGCIYGQAGEDLNFEEIVLQSPEAVLPRYIIVYQKDGVRKLIN